MPPFAPAFARAVWISTAAGSAPQYISGCNNDLTSKQIVDWTCPPTPTTIASWKLSNGTAWGGVSGIRGAGTL